MPDPLVRPARDHAPQKQQDGSTRREPYTAQIRRFHAQAWTNLGDWSLEHDDFAQASTAYAKALATDPTLDRAGIFFGLGKALFVLDRPKEALPYLERVGERLDPPLRRGDRVVSRADLRRAGGHGESGPLLRHRPPVWRPRSGLGFLRARRGRGRAGRAAGSGSRASPAKAGPGDGKRTTKRGAREGSPICFRSAACGRAPALRT